MGAARAAQQQNEYKRRDDHLRHIRPKDSNSELALGITRAELQLQQNQLEQSLATLQRCTSHGTQTCVYLAAAQ